MFEALKLNMILRKINTKSSTKILVESYQKLLNQPLKDKNISNILVAINKSFSNPNMDSNAVRMAMLLLINIVKKNEQNAETTLRMILQLLNQAHVDKDIVSQCFKMLLNILSLYPHKAQTIINIIAQTIDVCNIDISSIRLIYRIIFDIHRINKKENKPINPEIINILEKCVNLKQYDYYSLKMLFRILYSVADDNNNFEEQILNILNAWFCSPFENSEIICLSFNVFTLINSKNILPTEDIISVLKNSVNISCHDANTLDAAISVLSEININNTQQSNIALEILQIIRKNPKLDCSNGARLNILFKILKQNPNSKDNILKIIQQECENKDNSAKSLSICYKLISAIISDNKNIDNTILNIYKIGLDNPNNNAMSYNSAILCISAFISTQPELVAEILLNILKQYHTGSNNTGLSQLNISPSFRSIIIAKPDLSNKIISRLLSDCTLSINDTFIKNCMKYVTLSDFVNSPNFNEGKNILQISHNSRFLSDTEFEYAIKNLEPKDLLHDRLFLLQKRIKDLLSMGFMIENGLQINKVYKWNNIKASPKIENKLSSVDSILVPASFKLAKIFGSFYIKYLKKIRDFSTLENAISWLPNPMSEDKNTSFKEFIFNNIIYINYQNKLSLRPINDLQTIANGWASIPQTLENNDWQTILLRCRQIKYPNQKNAYFATEAFSHSISASIYTYYEDIYLASLNVPDLFDTTLEFKCGKYVGKFIKHSDVLSGFWGAYINSCICLNNAGESCAIAMMKTPYSQAFLVKNENDNIIAGSWVWENTEGKYREVCFDSIAVLGELKNYPEITNIYNQVSNYLAKNENCYRVTIGEGFTDNEIQQCQSVVPIPKPKFYGRKFNNSRVQYLLASNSKATPLDKNEAPTIYIRQYCQLDYKYILRLSREVSPNEHHIKLYPKTLMGLVMEGKNIGIVGYCIFSLQEKTIYEIKSMPKYISEHGSPFIKMLNKLFRKMQIDKGTWSIYNCNKILYQYILNLKEKGIISKIFKNENDANILLISIN